MAKLKKILLFFLLTGCMIIVKAEPIRGGHKVPDEFKYPFMVSLQSKINPMEQFCGGSIIDKRFILTAAHCLQKKKPKQVIVVAGTIDKFNASDSNKYNIDKWIVHKDFNDVTRDTSHDIALIKLQRDMDFSTNNVKPIPLDKKNFTYEGYPVVLAGFGRIGPKCIQRTRYLHDLKSTIVSPRDYEQTYPTYDRRNDFVICTYSYEKKKYLKDKTKFFSACQGDSGGPLIAEHPETKEMMLIGVLSQGDEEMVASTKVYTFLDWIIAEKIKFAIDPLTFKK